VRGWPPQGSAVTQDSMRCRPIHGASPCLGLGLCLCLPLPLAPGALQAFETSQPLPMQRLASMHPSMHPCMADSSSAWWRCLASDPGRDTGHSRQLFALLRREASQNNPALLPTRKNPLRPTSTPQGKHIVISPIAHRPSPRQRREWQYAWTAGQGGETLSVDLRIAADCKLHLNT